MIGRRLIFGALALALVVVGVGAGLVAISSTRPSAPAIASSNPVEAINIRIPNRIADLPFVDQNGKATSLASFRGRVVVLANFMTSCQEQCPITTGALLVVRSALARAHLADKVTIVEATVDPGRDRPERLLAYEKRFGIPFTLLTGSASKLGQLWKWFGTYSERVTEDNPPGIDWQTGKPYSYDIVHSDDVFLIDGNGVERALVDGHANLNRQLPKRLATLLNNEGRQNLDQPGAASWKPDDLLQAIGSVVGRKISG